MAATALEEKINKIRQQNEEIRRRYEEVEQDKKKAAESNALVQMVPSTDWPERKEPPEFSNPPRNSHKPKNSMKEHGEQPLQHHVEGRKGHSFAQGEGPPPDPKYNFLADSDREELSTEYTRESSGGKGRGRSSRGNLRRRGGGRDGPQKDGRMHSMGYRDGYQPEYDAWRAERNRIDEDRISRQRTAEGNWRREWDNNKIHIADEVSKRESRATFGDAIKRDKHFDNRHHSDGHDYTNYSRGGNQRGRGAQRGFYNNHDHRYSNSYDQHGRNAQTSVKNAPHYLSADERTVTATDKSIKVTLNPNASVTKGPVTSVKVNSPNIAGTGRVGPRQRTRVTYSSHSDFETNVQRDSHSFARQKSFEEKPKAVHYNNAQKVSSLKRTPSQKKKESKSPYAQRKEYKKEQPKEPRETPRSSHRRTDSESSAKQIADSTRENVSGDTNASEKEVELMTTDLRSVRLNAKDTDSQNEVDHKCIISENVQNTSEEMEDKKIVAINENIPSGKEENTDCVGSDDQECVAQSKFDDHSNPPAEKTALDLSVDAKEEKIQVQEANSDAVISSENMKNVDERTKENIKDEKLIVDEETENESTASPMKNSLSTIVPAQENHSESRSIDNIDTDKQIDDNDDVKEDCKEKQIDNIPLDNCDNIKYETIDAELCDRDNNQVSDENTAKGSAEFQEIVDLKKVSSPKKDDVQVSEVKGDSSNGISKESVETKDNNQQLEAKEESSDEAPKEIVESKDNIQQLEAEENSSKETPKEFVETKDNIQQLEAKEISSKESPKEIIEMKDSNQQLEAKENSNNETPKEFVETKDNNQQLKAEENSNNENSSNETPKEFVETKDNKQQLKAEENSNNENSSNETQKEFVETKNNNQQLEAKENSSNETPKEFVEIKDNNQQLEAKENSSNETPKEFVETKDNNQQLEAKENSSNETPKEIIKVKDNIEQFEAKETSNNETPKEIIEVKDNIKQFEAKEISSNETPKEIIEVKGNLDISQKKEESNNEIPNESVEVKDTVEVLKTNEESSNEITAAEEDKKNTESLKQSTENNETRDVPAVFPAAEIKSQDESKGE